MIKHRINLVVVFYDDATNKPVTMPFPEMIDPIVSKIDAVLSEARVCGLLEDLEISVTVVAEMMNAGKHAVVSMEKMNALIESAALSVMT
jgi:hypothetical protein